MALITSVCLQLSFNPQSTLIATGSMDNTAKLWAVDTGEESRRRDCHSTAPPSTCSWCFNSDGERASAK